MTWRPRKPASTTTPVPSVAAGTISLTPVQVAFSVIGQVPSLKNGRPIRRNPKTGKPFSARSDESSQYLENFVLQVPARYRNLGLGGLTTPLRSTVTVFYQSWRSDLDCAVIYDGLQLAGVVANDRFIREHHEYAEVDPNNPHCEIHLEEI